MSFTAQIKSIRCLLLILAPLLSILFVPETGLAQSHNYWTRSFNEESSLLSGAVVGGGAGPSAIFYNPSGISEIKASKLSFHASLFSFHFYNVKNFLGNGIDMSTIRGVIEPRFLSYMVQPKKYPNWSFEFAFLNNEKYKLQFSTAVDKNMDIIQSLPGEERYFAMFQYLNSYRDDWIGAGSSWKINPNLFIGASMFVSVRTLENSYSLDIEAYPLDDSIYVDDQLVPFYSANFQEADYVKFNDYRLLWKFGMLYKRNNISFGFCITSPSVGGIYSDGKQVSRKKKQSNIKYPDSDEFLPDFVIVDYQEKKNVEVNYKSPLSIAAGFTYYSKDQLKTLYTTMEYFTGTDPYKIVQANENPSLAAGTVNQDLPFDEWLTFVQGGKPILNAAVGYRWSLKENLLLMTGFRTDFNYRKNLDYGSYSKEKVIKGLDLDLYHISGGLILTILGQDFITGLQYSVGRLRNETQFTNLSDPVEFSDDGRGALQGTPQNTMSAFNNSVSVYFGATFNFGGGKSK
jgi:hypothetical protein